VTAYERTGWRDERISARHRQWGYNCPAVDLDFLVAEYNVGEPVALVEYKHESAQQAQLQHPTYRALSSLCRRADLPFMVVYYRPDPWRFLVVPVNERAVAFYRGPQSLSERRFVKSLYVMRERVVEAHVLAGLDDTEDEVYSWPAMWAAAA
jgi:hypothetical protein